jgi:hypothetical protein
VLENRLLSGRSKLMLCRAALRAIDGSVASARQRCRRYVICLCGASEASKLALAVGREGRKILHSCLEDSMLKCWHIVHELEIWLC